MKQKAPVSSWFRNFLVLLDVVGCLRHILLCWLARAERMMLKAFRPRGGKEHGAFATRSSELPWPDRRRNRRAIWNARAKNPMAREAPGAIEDAPLVDCQARLLRDRQHPARQGRPEDATLSGWRWRRKETPTKYRVPRKEKASGFVMMTFDATFDMLSVSSAPLMGITFSCSSSWFTMITTLFKRAVKCSCSISHNPLVFFLILILQDHKLIHSGQSI